MHQHSKCTTRWGHFPDGQALPDLLGQIPEDVPPGTVIAEGTRDIRHCHTAIIGP